MYRPTKRAWVKLWVEECLGGTIRFNLTPEERSVWYDLIILGGRCRQPGKISANENLAYPHSYIAGILNVPEKLLNRALDKLKATGRITEDETGIYLSNWSKYQSEYQARREARSYQKRYRYGDQRGEAPPDILEGLVE